MEIARIGWADTASMYAQWRVKRFALDALPSTSLITICNSSCFNFKPTQGNPSPALPREKILSTESPWLVQACIRTVFPFSVHISAIGVLKIDLANRLLLAGTFLLPIRLFTPTHCFGCSVTAPRCEPPGDVYTVITKTNSAPAWRLPTQPTTATSIREMRTLQLEPNLSAANIMMLDPDNVPFAEHNYVAEA